MDSIDALNILNSRVSAPASAEHNQLGCICGMQFGGGKTPAGVEPDKAPIEAHQDLLAMRPVELVREFKRLQEDRVRVYGLFER
jgi:hypothetical protein